MKSPECREALGARWYRFNVQPQEQVSFDPLTYLEEIHYDPIGALITSAMHTFIRQSGKIDDGAAARIAASLPPLPQMGLQLEDGSGAAPVSAAEAGKVYVPDTQREKNRRIWSEAFPDRAEDWFPDAWITPDDQSADP